MINWHWVIAAFLGGITLTLLLEISRRRKSSQTPLIFYLFPTITLLLGIGIWVISLEENTSSTKTAVSHAYTPPAHITLTQPTTEIMGTLPTPQISIQSFSLTSPGIMPLTPVPTQTSVRRLHIPALNLNKPVYTIPLEEGKWNVANLGNDVGWLETTAVHPNADRAMVFVGHMTFANDNLLEQGAFADIPSLPYGTAVILETDTDSHTYLVDFVRRVSPDDTTALYQESGDTILLLTCADWNPQQGIYENRLLVRASRQS